MGSSIFDMIGPVMIGPSSSHTAGVVRIGRVARHLLGEVPVNAEITFYNSFARTFEGHGSHKAVIGGLLDFATDDERIKKSLEIAQSQNIAFVFRSVPNASALHPNSIKIKVIGKTNDVEVTGISRGGGLVSIVGIEGYKCNFSAQNHTLIVKAKDVKGSISFITNVIAHDDCNIATMTVDRTGKEQSALQVIEMDHGLRQATIDYLRSLSWIERVIYIPDVHL